MDNTVSNLYSLDYKQDICTMQQNSSKTINEERYIKGDLFDRPGQNSM